jgi:hypothetical protein
MLELSDWERVGSRLAARGVRLAAVHSVTRVTPPQVVSRES